MSHIVGIHEVCIAEHLLGAQQQACTARQGHQPLAEPLVVSDGALEQKLATERTCDPELHVSPADVFFILRLKPFMQLPWSSMASVSLLLLAFILTTLNVLVVGGFIGKALTIHTDLESVKGRKRAQIVVLVNTILSFVSLVLLVLYAVKLGWQSFGSYARSQGCDLDS